eukprot:scpid52959/ scgid24607/ 
MHEAIEGQKYYFKCQKQRRSECTRVVRRALVMVRAGLKWFPGGSFVFCVANSGHACRARASSDSNHSIDENATVQARQTIMLQTNFGESSVVPAVFALTTEWTRHESCSRNWRYDFPSAGTDSVAQER